MVFKKRLLPIDELSDSDLNDNIRSFCGQYPVLKVALFKSQSDIEAAVSTNVKGFYELYFFIDTNKIDCMLLSCHVRVFE